MKKAILLALCLVVLGAGAAMADTLTYTNTTQALTQNGTKWDASKIYIGDTNKFLTSSASFETSGAKAGLLTITTNWLPSENDNYLGAYTAMLFVSTTGGTAWDYAIELDYTNTNTNLATVYKPTLVYQSSDTYYNANTYGKYFNVADVNHLIPVIATATLDSIDKVYVTWTNGTLNGGQHDGNTVAIDLSDILGTDPWSFIWGTATCGNGPITHGFDGMVPLPPSALLLGSGLLGLGLLGWRRKSKA